MENTKLTVETTETTRAKAAHAFGLDQPSALDAVKRSDFDSDEAYLNAATLYEMERSNPEYQATRRRLAAELESRQEQEQRKAQDAAYKEIRAAVKLDYIEQREVDREAAELARRDLAAGKIGASDLGAAIASHAEKLTAQRLDTKAGNQLFNGIIRGRRGGGNK